MNLLPEWAGHAGLGLLAGCAAGLAHFATLGLNVRLLMNGASWPALGLQLARLGTLGLVFVALARLGGAPVVLGAGLGLLIARQVVLRFARTVVGERPGRRA